MKPRAWRRPILLVVGGLLLAGLLITVFHAASSRLEPASTVGRSALFHVPAPIDNQDHLYVLDGWGGVHPVGASPQLATTASWPHRDLAFSLALFPDGTGGYVLDGTGGLHALGDAPAVDSNVYWPGWLGARQVLMAPWSSRGHPAGYLLDADGGIHAFGGAPAVSGFATWPALGLARGMALIPDSTPFSVGGYTLDAHGGVHPFGEAPPVSGYAVWPGEDLARGLVLLPASTATSAAGYTLDAHGGIHPFGGAPAVTGTASWPSSDMADSLVAWTKAPSAAPGGWVLDRQGDVHAFGSAPALAPSVTWPGWDIARGLAGAGSGGGSTERLILEPEPIRDGWGAYFNQRDARWAAQRVGGGAHTVWKIGCLLSDLAMVYSHFGFRGVTPATIAAHAAWFTGGGAIFNSALAIPGHTTVMRMDPGWPWIRSELAHGHPVIVGMNLPSGGTHFVVLTALDGPSDYWTDDPWEQNAMHVTFSGDWSDRGPVYEAIAFS